ncbi:MAG: AraC family transcriptional regulator [Bacteroidales bacterium]|nr:AraC family transcriptional regulator [Bacteroidales bacterium]
MQKDVYDNTYETNCKDMILIQWEQGIPSQEMDEVFMGMHAFLLVRHGKVEIMQGQTLLRLSAGDVADFIGDSPLEFVAVSSDLEAYFLILGKTADNFIFRRNPPFPLSYVIDVRNCPVTSVSADTMQLLSTYMKHIKILLADEGHLFRAIALQCELMKLAVDLANCRMKKHQNDAFHVCNNRQELLFARFIRLLERHVHAERSITFYANELCISSQYLAKISRECSGQTVHDWICHTLLDQIIQLMNSPELTLVQIAEKLNFSDQASFCKFFRKHMNMSPTEFRKLK